MKKKNRGKFSQSIHYSNNSSEKIFFNKKVVGKVSSVIFTKKKPVNLRKIEKSKDKVFLEFPRKKEEVFFCVKIRFN